jgi:hypothetical protein
MSNPDILLSIQAYSLLKKSKNEKMLQSEDHDEITGLQGQIERLEQLTDSLVNEWERRGNG